MYYTWKNIKKLYKSNKFKISTPTWNGKFDLPDVLYILPNIQDFPEHILKNIEKRLIVLQ